MVMAVSETFLLRMGLRIPVATPDFVVKIIPILPALR